MTVVLGALIGLGILALGVLIIHVWVEVFKENIK